MEMQNYEDKIVELSQEEIMDIVGGSRSIDFWGNVWDSIVGIFKTNDSSEKQ